MDVNKLTLNDWGRRLKYLDRSPDTITNYLATGRRFAEWLNGADILTVDRDQVQDYLAQFGASTGATYHRHLTQLFKWAIAEELIDASPIERLAPPTVTEPAVPLVALHELKALLKTVSGRDFMARRDNALFRLMLEPGGMRLAEVSKILLADADLEHDEVGVMGKGRRARVIPFGAKTGSALSRYIRMRAAHRYAKRDQLWLGKRGPMTTDGVYQMFGRRCDQAGIARIHPHQLRHTAADAFLEASHGDEGAAMRLFGWKSAQMPKRYGAAGADRRAHAQARRLNITDKL